MFILIFKGKGSNLVAFQYLSMTYCLGEKMHIFGLFFHEFLPCMKLALKFNSNLIVKSVAVNFIVNYNEIQNDCKSPLWG